GTDRGRGGAHGHRRGAHRPGRRLLRRLYGQLGRRTHGQRIQVHRHPRLPVEHHLDGPDDGQLLLGSGDAEAVGRVLPAPLRRRDRGPPPRHPRRQGLPGADRAGAGAVARPAHPGEDSARRRRRHPAPVPLLPGRGTLDPRPRQRRGLVPHGAGLPGYACARNRCEPGPDAGVSPDAIRWNRRADGRTPMTQPAQPPSAVCAADLARTEAIVHDASILDGDPADHSDESADTWIAVSAATVIARGRGDGWKDLAASASVEVIDGAGGYLAPAYVDIHCHGAGGASAEDGRAGLDTILAVHRRHGTRGLALSYVSDTIDGLCRSLAAGAELVRDRSEVIGLHAEGPF